jgi:hypothetical protein
MSCITAFRPARIERNPCQAQQVQGGGAQRRHHAGTVAPIAVVVLIELGFMDPVPVLQAPIALLAFVAMLLGR